MYSYARNSETIPIPLGTDYLQIFNLKSCYFSIYHRNVIMYTVAILPLSGKIFSFDLFIENQE